MAGHSISFTLFPREDSGDLCSGEGIQNDSSIRAAEVKNPLKSKQKQGNGCGVAV